MAFLPAVSRILTIPRHRQDKEVEKYNLVFFKGTPNKASYLLPLVFRHGLQLVTGHQLLQHLGNHDKLGLVIVDRYPEEQSCNVDHFFFGANMIASQVLWQLLEDRNIFYFLSLLVRLIFKPLKKLLLTTVFNVLICNIHSGHDETRRKSETGIETVMYSVWTHSHRIRAASFSIHLSGG